LDAAATPGPWDVWEHPIAGAGDAILEMVEQVQATTPLVDRLYLINAGGKCPGTTGCGPTSEANARLITTLRNHLPEIIAALERVEGER